MRMTKVKSLVEKLKVTGDYPNKNDASMEARGKQPAHDDRFRVISGVQRS